MRRKHTKIGKRNFTPRDIGRIFERGGDYMLITNMKPKLEIIGKYAIEPRFWYRMWSEYSQVWSDETWAFNEGKHRWRRVSNLEALLKFNHAI